MKRLIITLLFIISLFSINNSNGFIVGGGIGGDDGPYVGAGVNFGGRDGGPYLGVGFGDPYYYGYGPYRGYRPYYSSIPYDFYGDEPTTTYVH